MSGVTYGINREGPPEVWWSRELGLIWSDNGGRSYWRVEDGRAVEFFHLPAHARRYPPSRSLRPTRRWY